MVLRLRVRLSSVRSSLMQNRPLNRRDKGGQMTSASASNRRLGWVMGLTSTAYFMVIFDSVVVIMALPRWSGGR